MEALTGPFPVLGQMPATYQGSNPHLSQGVGAAPNAVNPRNEKVPCTLCGGCEGLQEQQVMPAQQDQLEQNQV